VFEDSSLPDAEVKTKMTPPDTLSQLRAGKLAGIKRLDLSAGLTEFPREIFDLADSLEILNLSQNKLSALPDDFGRLRKLRILFCSENAFTDLPAVLGTCPSLSMVGFKSNQINTVDEASLPPTLRWLILTDNHISQLPSSVGRCRSLQKLMLSGNRIEHLPDEMSACVNLELLRLSSNQFRELPQWLLSLPRLSWLAFAANPFSETSDEPPATSEIDWADIVLQEKLGEGASGIIYQAHWHHDPDLAALPVAVKVFKGAVTSDGLPVSEMAGSITAGVHLNLIQVIGKITNQPDGTLGLVMALIDPVFVNLAGPPSFDSCTRDIYSDDQTFSVATALRLALGVASAAAHLHERGILHGDLYGHNVLWKPDGECLLGDFGASSVYQPDSGVVACALQSIEVRAFGCLLEELLTRCVTENHDGLVMESLWSLQVRCVSPEVPTRPLFSAVQSELQEYNKRYRSSPSGDFL
jgi:hypothetical protein